MPCTSILLTCIYLSKDRRGDKHDTYRDGAGLHLTIRVEGGPFMPTLRPLPLSTTTTAMRSSSTSDLLAFINVACDHIDAVEPALQALLPEAQRRTRLLSAASSLGQRYPDLANRPPLYGT